MSSELRDKDYHFVEYALQRNNRRKGPPLTSKKSRLIAAATQNDLSTLKKLLDSPKWYGVQDRLRFNLLQIAILRGNAEVFDYLLSLNDFPLEAVNEEGDTALIVALSYYVCNDPKAVSWEGIGAFQGPYSPGRSFISIDSHYSYELIKKGANFNKMTRSGDTLLHCALDKRYLSVAQLMLEKGADVNAPNSHGRIIPLSYYCNDKAITMLLCYGADPRNDPTYQSLFDRLLISADITQVLLENFLYFTFDEWNLCKPNANSLLKLAMKDSPLFHQVISLTSEIITTDIDEINCLLLFSIDLQYLRVFIEKYPYFVKAVLQSYGQHSYVLIWRKLTFRLENFEMLLQSSLCLDTMELIPKLHSSRFIELLKESYTKRSKDKFIELIYCLLSYGMSLNEQDLDHIYSITGYSVDFKNLLFMDLQKSVNKEITNIIPRLMYDVTLDLHNSLRKSYTFWRSVDWNQLFAYFAHPKFQDIYFEYHSCKKTCKCGVQKGVPKIPLLQELARDAFRKHFIQVFEINTAKQFYGLIKLLPIRSRYKKIITFETKLYKLKK